MTTKRNNRANRIAAASLSLSKRRAERASRWVATGEGDTVAKAVFVRYRFYESAMIANDAVPMPCDGKPEQLRLF